MEGDGVSRRDRFEAIYMDAGIDGLGVGLWVAVLSVVEADVRGSSAHSHVSEAPVLRTALREWRKLHVDVPSG